MSRLLVAALALGLLAGCGVDGDPERPAAQTGPYVKGEGWIGVLWSDP